MKSRSKIIIGLTGGIATGKSTVAEIFRESGAEIIDADKVAREVADSGTVSYRRLEKVFPAAFADGVFNRRVLREAVFGDKDALEKLNSIMHPPIYAGIYERIRASETETVVAEVPLLFEAEFETLVDVTVGTVCKRETQIERLCARDGISPTAAARILAAQMDPDEKAARCDFTLRTDAGEAELKAAATEVLRQIKTAHARYKRKEPALSREEQAVQTYTGWSKLIKLGPEYTAVFAAVGSGEHTRVENVRAMYTYISLTDYVIVATADGFCIGSLSDDFSDKTVRCWAEYDTLKEACESL